MGCAVIVMGINVGPGGWHDPAACIVDEHGHVLAFAEEERLTRRKHALKGGARSAAAYCLKETGLDVQDVDIVAVGWNIPLVARWYGLTWAIDDAVAWLYSELNWQVSLRDAPEIRFVPHHLAHATAAFFASDFNEAAVLVIDGNGDDESISVYQASRATGLIRRSVWSRMFSVGWLYDAACEFVGFDFLEAGKLMGLAAWGAAKRFEPWPLLPDAEPRSPIRPTGEYTYADVIRAWRDEFRRYAGVDGVQRPRDELHNDEIALVAALSAQVAVETVVTSLARQARAEAGSANLCLAGGVALNCKANGLLTGDVFVPPIPNDSGVALGAAWHIAPPRDAPERLSPYLGPPLGGPPDTHGLCCTPVDIEVLCASLEAGRIGAVVTGRGEIGPRALGHRSIIASPANKDMRDRLNRVKGRESWRPFGASALASRAGALWEPRSRLTDYMIGGTPVSARAREVMPAAVHVDGTTRPHVVDEDEVGTLTVLLRAWGDRAGGALINTSFNMNAEPLVSSSDDALAAFRGMDLDFLVLDEQIITRGSRWWHV